jgi:hypothetical protein
LIAEAGHKTWGKFCAILLNLFDHSKNISLKNARGFNYTFLTFQ